MNYLTFGFEIYFTIVLNVIQLDFHVHCFSINAEFPQFKLNQLNSFLLIWLKFPVSVLVLWTQEFDTYDQVVSLVTLTTYQKMIKLFCLWQLSILWPLRFHYYLLRIFVQSAFFRKPSNLYILWKINSHGSFFFTVDVLSFFYINPNFDCLPRYLYFSYFIKFYMITPDQLIFLSFYSTSVIFFTECRV